MGGLRIFGRRWEISSDDFVFPCVTEAMLRFLWWLVVVIVYSLQSYSACGAPPSSLAHLHAFIIVCLVLNSIDIALAIAISWISSLGTINHDYPRRKIKYFLYPRAPLGIFAVIWLIVGTVWAFQNYPFWPWNMDCVEPVLITARVTVFLGWILVFVTFVAFYVIFDPLGRIHHRDGNIRVRSRDMWRKRFRWACCFCLGRDDNATHAYEDVANLFSTFFTGQDMVITDIWAGLLLIANREVQSLRVKSKKAQQAWMQPQGAAFAGDPETSDPDRPPAWMNMKNAARFMEFAMGVYGWPHFVFDRLSPRACMDLYRESRCCVCSSGNVVDDDVLSCNTAAFRLQTGLKPMELFHVSFSNRIYEVPFVAAIDHVTESIVIAIRGSMSLKDAMTDLCVAGVSVRMGNESVYVHKGIHKSAEYVYDKLESEKILYDLFILYPSYDFVVTGHSLGAGVAAVLSLRLREMYPRVRCFAFAPPGCVVSRNNRTVHTDKFICSLVLGDDVIPRMSMATMTQLKTDVMDVLEHCDRPKFDILVRGCFKLICHPRDASSEATVGSDAQESIANASTNPGSVVDAENGRAGAPLISQSNLSLVRSSTSSYHSITGDSNPDGNIISPQSQSLNLDGTGLEGDEDIPLFCPGRIIHIRRHPGHIYRPEWSDYQNFDEVKLSSRMLLDHMPYNMMAALREVKFHNL